VPATRTFSSLLALLLASCLGFAQDAGQPARHPGPQSATGSQLVAWSQLQKPKPIPQFSHQQPDAEVRPLVGVFSGVVASSRGCLTLRAETSEYVIVEQESAKPYAGRQVRIAGTLDTNSGTLHLVSIEAAP
jgi:hypothetical protein